MCETTSRILHTGVEPNSLKFEKAQHRATRMMVRLREFNYEDRLSYLGLTTLETRKLKRDLIHAFKIIKVYDK